MNNNRKYIYGAILVIVVAAITTTAVFAVGFHKKPHVVTDIQGKDTKQEMRPAQPTLGSESLVKPEDRSPVVMSPDKIQNGKAIHVPILMYHHIGIAPATADATHRGLTVSPVEFEAQVAWLKKNGYESVNLHDLYFHIKEETYAWPKKPVIFTFDDGYADVFENAVPILKKYGYIGSFGIITENPGQTQGDNFYATWAQIAAAKADGMEMVCHTQNHFDGSNPKFTSNYIYTNLTGCQTDLKNHLSEAPPYLIYPYGHFTTSYISQALRAGFVMAFTVHEGSYVNTDDLMQIPRVRVNPGETIQSFSERLNS